jgi:hypothetical protein
MNVVYTLSVVRVRETYTEKTSPAAERHEDESGHRRECSASESSR